MRASILVAILLPHALGCGAAALTPGGAEVRLMEAEPPAGCEDVGSISAQGYDEDDAEIAMRNAAARRGANYVRLGSVKGSDSGKAEHVGTAFRCPGAR